jgi:hypothetical protein
MIELPRKYGTVLLDDEDAWILEEYWISTTRTSSTHIAVRTCSKKTGRFGVLGTLITGVTVRDHVFLNGNVFDFRRDNVSVEYNEFGYIGVRRHQDGGYRAVYSDTKSGGAANGLHYPYPELAALDAHRMRIWAKGDKALRESVRCINKGFPVPPCDGCNAQCLCCCMCAAPLSAMQERLLDRLGLT